MKQEEDNTFDFKQRSTYSAQLPKDVQKLAVKAKENLEGLQISAIENTSNNSDIQKQLDIISSLKFVKIPTKEGDKVYYSIADSAGGVTEKTCLIDEQTLKQKLEDISKMKNVSNMADNKIKMNAILKHPKAGKDTEVQREAIGLEIARILGFEAVTKSTMVNHDTGNGRHPCLFVPFGDMKLLTEKIEHAESFHGRLKASEDKNVEDFGKYAGFFALCSDPDFIGKAGQNKGLTGAPEQLKRLYIFDQVFMTDKNLSLDRSFNLVPTNILSKLPNFIARHFMGRNKSVINDASFEEKIGGVINILGKKEKIQGMFKNVIDTHRNKNPKTELDKTLEADARQCLKSFNDRVVGFEKLFPLLTVNGQTKKVSALASDLNTNDDALNCLKKSMLVTQLINKPKNVDKYGKPYRAPFFNTSGSYVKSVSIQDDQVEISFARKWGQPLSDNKREILKKNGFSISADGKSATISKQNLLQLDFTDIAKELGENKPSSNSTKDYRNIMNKFRGHTPSNKASETKENAQQHTSTTFGAGH